MDFITLIFLILLALPIIYLFMPSKNTQRIEKYMSRLPGPPSYPIIGTAIGLIGLKRDDIFEYSRKQIKQYGPVYRTCLGKSRQILHIQKPKHFELILNNTNQLVKGISYNSVKPWLGEGLLTTSNVAKWHSHRKLITPAFHFKILDNFVEIFNEKADVLVDILKPKANGEVFNMFPHITHCALDIICETAMGIQINAMGSGSGEFVDAVYDISELALYRIMKPWLKSDFVYFNTKNGKRFRECVEILHGFTNKVLQERRNTPRRERKVSENEDIGKKKRLTFLDLVLKASQDGNILTDAEMRAEIDTFMFAGHDTTSAGICWTLFLLGNNPEWQDLVYKEIEDLFDGQDRKLTIKDLADLKYLDRVVKEALRLYPSAPLIMRQLSRDVQIDQYLIPSGANVTLHIYDLHRDPESFPNPDAFDPDRFLPENTKLRHPYAYVPFSAGPRNCIGQKFAMYEEKTVLAKILRSYKVRAIETPETVKMLMEIILRPRNGLQVILEPR